MSAFICLTVFSLQFSTKYYNILCNVRLLCYCSDFVKRCNLSRRRNVDSDSADVRHILRHVVPDLWADSWKSSAADGWQLDRKHYGTRRLVPRQRRDRRCEWQLRDIATSVRAKFIPWNRNFELNALPGCAEEEEEKKFYFAKQIYIYITTNTQMQTNTPVMWSDRRRWYHSMVIRHRLESMEDRIACC